MHRVRAGMVVRVALEAFPDVRLSGRVKSIGTLAREPGGGGDDSKRFDLLVELDPSEADLRPEMTARVDIVIAERDDVLLLPVNAVFEAEGATVVVRLGTLGSEVRRVELGASNDRFVEVLSGLAEHDGVVLAAPGSDSQVPLAAGPDVSDGVPITSYDDPPTLAPR